MKTISIFNNKGGVGKTTLLYHTGWALSELGYKVLMIDLDPQCNLTINSIPEDIIHSIWQEEDNFISDFLIAKNESQPTYDKLIADVRSVHFIVKPIEDGTSDFVLTKPYSISQNLDLIPGRLTLHSYESAITKRWSEAYTGNPLAIRTLTSLRNLAYKYAERDNYDYILFDTSPSLGDLNKITILTSDFFYIPCNPDIFSVYGIKNIGKYLLQWREEYHALFTLLSEKNRALFPKDIVKLIGYTIYNAKKYTGSSSQNIAKAHLNYAEMLPRTITESIDQSFFAIDTDTILTPIGENSVTHSDNTMATMAQKYHTAIWNVPDQQIESSDASTITANRARYYERKDNYYSFAKDLIKRVQS